MRLATRIAVNLVRWRRGNDGVRLERAQGYFGRRAASTKAFSSLA